MDYLDRYLNLYSGQNRKALYKMMHDLADSIRTDNAERIASMLSEDCVADISMLGKGITGKQAICEALSFPVKDVNLRRVTLSGVTSRSCGDVAQQYAQVQCIFGYDDGENIFPFVFGGHFCISYRKIDGQWKMSAIKFDLIYESGNNAIVAGKWKLIDYSIYSGHAPMINILYDSPWRVIPVDDEPMTELEQILDALEQVSATTDGGDWEHYAKCLSQNFTMDMSARGNTNKSNASTADALMSSVRSNVDWIKGKYHKEPHLQHVDNLIDIRFNEDHTRVEVISFRSEFNRLYNNIFDRETVHAMAYTAIHDNYFALEDGMWKLETGTFIPHQEFRPVDDDCIQYDDFICGGKTWEEITK